LDPLGHDSKADIAVLKSPKPLPPSHLIPSEFEVGEDARWGADGFPAVTGEKIFRMKGLVAAVRSDGAADDLQLTVDIGDSVTWEGASGAPVCVGGWVVGILTVEAKKLRTVRAARIAPLLKLLERLGRGEAVASASQDEKRYRLERLFEYGRGARHVSGFYGHKSILNQLTEASKSLEPKIIMLHGPPGIGKTTIVRAWIESLKREDDLTKLGQAFAWSFSGQGLVSARAGENLKNRGSPWTLELMGEAGRHFRGLGYQFKGAELAERKGDLLARALIDTGGLMIVDGVEPFQRLPGVQESGFHDKELQDFFEILYTSISFSRQRPWLLILTSYWPLPHPANARYQPIEVPALDEQNSADLLRNFRLGGQPDSKLHVEVPPDFAVRVDAEQHVLESAARTVGCQPLALVLLASYLISNQGGTLRLVSKDGQTGVKFVMAGEPLPPTGQPPQDHNRRIVNLWIDFFSRRPFDTQDHVQLQSMLQLTRTLSLFEGASVQQLAPLLRSRSRRLKRLTNRIRHTKQLRKAMERLLGLDILRVAPSGKIDFAHPLLREQFADRFEDAEPHTWAEAHEALFKDCLAHVEEESEDELVLRLARAVRHGCRSAVTIGAAWEVAMRVLRESEEGRALWQRIAARGDDLALLTNFIDRRWDSCREGLDREQQGELFNAIGYDLQKLCRSRESISAFRHAVITWTSPRGAGSLPETKRKYPLLAIRSYGVLIKSHIACLELLEASRCAEAAIKIANDIIEERGKNHEQLESDESFRCIFAYASLGWVSHMLGRDQTAADAFAKMTALEDVAAEKVESDAEQPPEKRIPKIRTQKMVEYSDYLIECGELDRAEWYVSRAHSICNQLAVISDKYRRSVAVDMAFNHLLFGRLFSARYGNTKEQPHYQEASRHLREAEEQGWALDLMDCWLQAHLGWADLLLLAGEPSRAEQHLDRAERFCASAQVPRFQFECHLLRSRLLLAKRDQEQDHVKQVHYLTDARKSYNAARRMAQDCGLLPRLRMRVSSLLADTLSWGEEGSSDD